MGFAAAVKHIREYGSAMKVLAQWRKDNKRGCHDEYVASVKRAITMFRYCWVVDEETKSIVNINNYDESRCSTFDIKLFLDPKPDTEIALAVYNGELPPAFLLPDSDAFEECDPPPPEPIPSATTIAPCHDASVLSQFHLTKFPPYDRAMTKTS